LRISREFIDSYFARF